MLQPRLWVMWPSKSSVSDGLLYVNCSVTNRTQICFQSTQVVDCLPGVWVLVLYWRPFYFFVVIVESLLHIYICLLFILFQVFCRLLWWFLHRRKCCWLQIPLWYVVFNSLWNCTQRSAHYTNGCDEVCQLVWNAQIWSTFASQWVDSMGTCAQLCLRLLVNCNSLLQHSRLAWSELFVNHAHTHSVNNLRWQPQWLRRLTSLPKKSCASLQKTKSIKIL